MKNRCFKVGAHNYPKYGGRGITVCERWKNNFEAFLEDMGERPAGTTLDRINNDGNYEPGNCRWATAKVQSNNKGNCRRVEFNGESLTIGDWARKLGHTKQAMRWRIENWPLERALTMKEAA